MAPASVVDWFAGPGGWDEGMRTLGIVDVLGIEWDDAACATSEAAGHRRLCADVAALDPADFDGIEGATGSPPCTTFSAAGGRTGRLVVDRLHRAITAALEGRDERAATIAAAAPIIGHQLTDENRRRRPDKQWTADRLALEADRLARTTALVIEPARWLYRLRPRWVALEQVPAVLPLWETTAAGLRQLGYSTWAGTLCAADYGVPQVRTRAFLIARLDGPAVPPAPTHAERPEPSLFGPELAPWVAMADALGSAGGARLKANRGAGCAERHRHRPSRPGQRTGADDHHETT